MAQKLGVVRYGIPLDINEQYELLGELLSAQARVSELELDGAWMLARAREDMLKARIEMLEQCRDELTKLVQELEAELKKCKRTKK
ncbi:hypothetical protein CCP3SC15_1310002 [Gammaproteobacteria bacterium]